MKPYVPSVFVRLIFLALLVKPLLAGGLNSISMNLVIFVVTLPIAWLGLKDVRWSLVDAFLLTVSAAANALTLIGTPLFSTIIGLDKAFHFLGGFGCGLLGALALRSYVRDRYAYPLLIIAVAMAIGAGWEVFEWLFLLFQGVADDSFNKLLFSDTMLDIVADTLGASLVALYWFIKNDSKSSK